MFVTDSVRAQLLALVGEPIVSGVTASTASSSRVCSPNILSADGWASLIRQALVEGLGPLLSHQLARKDYAIPSAAADTLQHGIVPQRAWSDVRSRATLNVLQHLQSIGIDARVYKGQPLAQALYGDHRLKTSGDIDVVVAAADAFDAAVQLESVGYSSKVAVDWFKNKTFLKLQKECSFSSLGGALCVDLHWRLCNRWNTTPIMEHELFSAEPCLDFVGNALPWYDWPLLWRMQLGHLISSDWRGLKTFVDFVHLTDRLTDDELQQTLLRCHALGAGRAALVALTVNSELFSRRVRPIPRLMQQTSAKSGTERAANSCVARLRADPRSNPTAKEDSALHRLGALLSSRERLSSLSQFATPAMADFEQATPHTSATRLTFNMVARRLKTRLRTASHGA